MRVVLALVLLFGLALTGCAHKKPAPAPASSAPRAGTGAAPAQAALAGVVTRFEPVARFVVLTFPMDRMPALDQRLGVYRNGVKVGQLRVSGPQRNNNIVADIVSGEAQIGDQVRPD